MGHQRRVMSRQFGLGHFEKGENPGIRIRNPDTEKEASMTEEMTRFVIVTAFIGGVFLGVGVTIGITHLFRSMGTAEDTKRFERQLRARYGPQVDVKAHAPEQQQQPAPTPMARWANGKEIR